MESLESWGLFLVPLQASWWPRRGFSVPFQATQELCIGMHSCRIRRAGFAFSLGLLDTSKNMGDWQIIETYKEFRILFCFPNSVKKTPQISNRDY